MTQNGADFEWTDTREQAALHVARDEQTNAVIAASCGVTRRTLDRWKTHPVFLSRVQEHRDAWRKAVMSEGIADRVERVRSLNDRWNRMHTVIHERAEALDGQVAGGGTGLLVRTEKQIGAGERAIHVVEYAVDTGLLKAILETEKQAAQELGQWSDRVDINVAVEELVRQIVAETGDPEEIVRPFVTDFVAEKKRRNA